MKIPALFAAAALAATALIAPTPATANPADAAAATRMSPSAQTASAKAVTKKPTLQLLSKKRPIYEHEAYRKGLKFSAANFPTNTLVKICDREPALEGSQTDCTKLKRFKKGEVWNFTLKVKNPGIHDMYYTTQEKSSDDNDDYHELPLEFKVLEYFVGGKLTLSPKSVALKRLRTSPRPFAAKFNKHDIFVYDYKFTVRKKTSSRLIESRVIPVSDGPITYRPSKKTVRYLAKHPGKYVVKCTPEDSRTFTRILTVTR